MKLDERLKRKGIVSIEYIGGTFDRMAVYNQDGTLKLTDFPDIVEGQGWPPTQEVVLRNWEEIVRLRDFLNSLGPIETQVKQQEEVPLLERASA